MAPIGGGTLVTLTGKNMGTSVKSISGLSLAGIPCRLIKEKYIVSNKYVLHFAETKHRKIYIIMKYYYKGVP